MYSSRPTFNNDIFGIELDNWPPDFPQILENKHIATEYRIWRKRSDALTGPDALWLVDTTLKVSEPSDLFFSVDSTEERKRFHYYDNGLLPGKEYCYKIQPINSHNLVGTNMICGANCGEDNADDLVYKCVETVKQFDLTLNNFKVPHIIESYEHDFISYEIENGEYQFIETVSENVPIENLSVCNDYDGLWDIETQTCKLDPRPFLDRIEVAYKSVTMNGDTNWIQLPSIFYDEDAVADTFNVYLDIDGDNEYTDEDLIGQIPHGHIQYDLNLSEYVQIFAKDGKYGDDVEYNDFFPESEGNFGAYVINDDVKFRFRLYDHGDFNGNSQEYSQTETQGALIVTSDTLIFPFWKPEVDPFEDNSGAAGARFMLGYPFDVTGAGISLNSSFSDYFIDSQILQGEFIDEWLVLNQQGTFGSQIETGRANILWLKYPNILKFGGEIVKNKSVLIKEGWNLLANPLVASIHKRSLLFATPMDMNNCSVFNGNEENCLNADGCIWDEDLDTEEMNDFICKSVLNWDEAISNNYISPTINTWNPGINGYEEIEMLEPFHGFWLQVGDLYGDGIITENEYDPNNRFEIHFTPNFIPENDSSNIEWEFKLSMTPRRVDNALSNQYGSDYIEIGLADSGVVSDDFVFGEDEHNIKGFQVSYPGDLFIQRTDWEGLPLTPDNLRFYKDYREIKRPSWFAEGTDNECNDLEQQDCEEAVELSCEWDEADSECNHKHEGAYVWNLTAIIVNATNVSTQTLDDWRVKLEWDLLKAQQALYMMEDIAETDTQIDTVVFEMHYVKPESEEIGSLPEIINIDLTSNPNDLLPAELDCTPTNPENVCIDIPYNDLLKLENMDIDSTFTWNVRLVLGNPIELAYFGEEEEEESITDLGLPKEFQFGNAYPNPFNPTTKFDFALPISADITVEVFNVLGQKVVTIKNAERMNAGYHSLTFNGYSLSSGVYLINAKLGEKYRRVQKIILFK